MFEQDLEDGFEYSRRSEQIKKNVDIDDGEDYLEEDTDAGSLLEVNSDGQVEFSPLYNLYSPYNTPPALSEGRASSDEDDLEWVKDNLDNIDNSELAKVLDYVAHNGAVDYVDDLLNLEIENSEDVPVVVPDDTEIPLQKAGDHLVESREDSVGDAVEEVAERVRAATEEMLAVMEANEGLVEEEHALTREPSMISDRQLSDRPLYVPSDSNRSLKSEPDLTTGSLQELGMTSAEQNTAGGPQENPPEAEEVQSRQLHAESNNSLYCPEMLDVGQTQVENGSDSRVPSVAFTTKFQPKYWRNDRKNLQCFPFCVEHDDYYKVRLQKLVHQRKGTCGTSVRAIVTGLDLSQEQMKDLSRVYFPIGRISLLGPEGSVGFLKPEQEIPAADFTAIASSSVKATIRIKEQVLGPEEGGVVKPCVELEFVQNLWKVDMVLSKKRRPVNIPSKIPRYAFEVLLFRKTYEGGGYLVVAQHVSAPFQIASTRTLNRELKALEEAPGTQMNRQPSQAKRKIMLEMAQDGLHTESTKRFKREMLFVQQVKGDIAPRAVKEEKGSPTAAQSRENGSKPIQPQAESKASESAKKEKKEVASSAKPTSGEEGASAQPPAANLGPSVERREGAGGQEVKPEGSDSPKETPSAPPPKEDQGGGSSTAAERTTPNVREDNLHGVETATTVPRPVERRRPAETAEGEYTELEFSLPVMYIICILGGIFGVHRFLMDDPFWGKFYACTLGGLGIGYIIDLYRLPKLYEASNEKLRKLAMDPYYREPDLLSVTDASIVLFSTGLFGGHHFLVGDKSTGFLYLFTFGLLGLGWLHDFCTIRTIVARYNAKQRDLFNLQYGTRNEAGIEMQNV